jgi:hypothetical protein
MTGFAPHRFQVRGGAQGCGCWVADVKGRSNGGWVADYLHAVRPRPDGTAGGQPAVVAKVPDRRLHDRYSRNREDVTGWRAHPAFNNRPKIAGFADDFRPFDGMPTRRT